MWRGAGEEGDGGGAGEEDDGARRARKVMARGGGTEGEGNLLHFTPEVWL